MVMEMGDKSGVAQKPIRKSGGFSGRIVPGVFIGDCVVILEDAVFLVGEGGREHVGGPVVGSVNAGSGVVWTIGLFIFKSVKAVGVRVRGGVDEVIR